jgi:nucleotide-binding universal stress UspA family protein
MTTHGRGGLGRLLFGSVAEAVLRHPEIPVFLMRLTKSQMRTRGAPEPAR